MKRIEWTAPQVVPTVPSASLALMWHNDQHECWASPGCVHRDAAMLAAANVPAQRTPVEGQYGPCGDCGAVLVSYATHRCPPTIPDPR